MQSGCGCAVDGDCRPSAVSEGTVFTSAGKCIQAVCHMHDNTLNKLSGSSCFVDGECAAGHHCSQNYGGVGVCTICDEQAPQVGCKCTAEAKCRGGAICGFNNVCVDCKKSPMPGCGCSYHQDCCSTPGECICSSGRCMACSFKDLHEGCRCKSHVQCSGNAHCVTHICVKCPLLHRDRGCPCNDTQQCLPHLACSKGRCHPAKDTDVILPGRTFVGINTTVSTKVITKAPVILETKVDTHPAIELITATRPPVILETKTPHPPINLIVSTIPPFVMDVDNDTEVDNETEPPMDMPDPDLDNLLTSRTVFGTSDEEDDDLLDVISETVTTTNVEVEEETGTTSPPIDLDNISTHAPLDTVVNTTDEMDSTPGDDDGRAVEDDDEYVDDDITRPPVVLESETVPPVELLHVTHPAVILEVMTSPAVVLRMDATRPPIDFQNPDPGSEIFIEAVSKSSHVGHFCLGLSCLPPAFRIAGYCVCPPSTVERHGYCEEPPMDRPSIHFEDVSHADGNPSVNLKLLDAMYAKSKKDEHPHYRLDSEFIDGNKRYAAQSLSEKEYAWNSDCTPPTFKGYPKRNKESFTVITVTAPGSPREVMPEVKIYMEVDGKRIFFQPATDISEIDYAYVNALDTAKPVVQPNPYSSVDEVRYRITEKVLNPEQPGHQPYNTNYRPHQPANAYYTHDPFSVYYNPSPSYMPPHQPNPPPNIPLPPNSPPPPRRDSLPPNIPLTTVETPPSPITPEPTAPETGTTILPGCNCPDGYHLIDERYCFLILDTPMVASGAAQIQCENTGGDLVTLGTDEKTNALKTLLVNTEATGTYLYAIHSDIHPDKCETLKYVKSRNMLRFNSVSCETQTLLPLCEAQC